MTNLRGVVRAMGGAVLVAGAAGILPAQMGNPVFNALINDIDGWCYPCQGADVGNQFACPCRIADPIIIKG